LVIVVTAMAIPVVVAKAPTVLATTNHHHTARLVAAGA
jgi:hypothetical protein